MTIDPYILTFSALTVIATIWVGFWSAKKSKTASDFYVAGRTVSVGWNASAISGEYLSAASFMGVAGMVMSSGYDALWYPVCYACGYLFLLLFIAGPLRRFGAYTIPDFAEGRFDSPLFRKIAVVFVLFIGFFYTMPQMKGAGTTLSYIFQDLDFRGTAFAFLAPHEKGETLKGLHYGVGVFLVGAVITLNVALGGMKGITLVQAFQYWLKMFAISVPIFVLMAVYGHYGKQLGVNGNIPHSANAASVATARVVWITNVTAIGEPMPSTFIANDIRGYVDSYVKSPVTRIKEAGKDIKDRLATGRTLVNRDIAWTFEAERVPELLFKWCWIRAVSQKRPPDHLLYSSDLANVLITPQPHGSLTNAAAADFLERQFAANQLTFRTVDPGVLLVCSVAAASYATSALDEFERMIGTRRQLPDKAPKDEIWLNPFGPLTTKAAKAAAVALTNSAQFIGNLPLRADLASDAKMTVNMSETNLPLALATYAELTGRTHLPRSTSLLGRIDDFFDGRLSRLNVIKPVPKTPGGVFYHRDGLFSAIGVKERLEALFKINSIVVVPEGTRHFRAINAAELGEKDGSPLAAVQKSWLQTHEKPLALLYTYSLIIALVCGTAGLPHILVRFYTNPDGVAAKRTTMWVMILIGVFYLFPPVFGVMGRNLLPELYAATGAKGTDKVVLELPRILNDSGSARASRAAVSALADRTGTADEASADTRGGARAPRKIPWGSILSGITCAGAFAAFMSTFSGLLVSLTGALAHDVYGRMLNPKSTPDQRMRMFKVCAVLCGVGAVLLGFFVEKFEINKMVGWAFAIAATSYFPLLFLSTWWRGVTMKGAATGMLVGGTFSLVAIASTMFADQAPWAKGLADFYVGHPLLRILAEQPAIWALPLAIGLMIAISKLTKQEVPSDIRLKMLVLHAPEKLGLKQEYIQEHQHGH